MKFRYSMLLATGFSGLALLTAKVLGFNNLSLMILAYGYPALIIVDNVVKSGIGLNSIYIQVGDQEVKRIGKEKKYRLEDQ